MDSFCENCEKEFSTKIYEYMSNSDVVHYSIMPTMDYKLNDIQYMIKLLVSFVTMTIICIQTISTNLLQITASVGKERW